MVLSPDTDYHVSLKVIVKLEMDRQDNDKQIAVLYYSMVRSVQIESNLQTEPHRVGRSSICAVVFRSSVQR